ncbi:tRNA (adenosine(37)-N6)-threonylcarbamoyltransferase complex dimerization subunit type 1 TsaB [Cyanobacterium aponinum UTEX 3222]|uniref:tRNA (adenosine(37)-N6)-threonylcarbamoyltransferase complex dimerization subunit type 1 TsaB n=1 Tax=Cyanobacterium aponinum TaxID=379064 RepID=UPI002B4BE58B|nr:tRNA (adenosine(37)-N6)-threonylcarbamoyltransferase complex dimerization subunit type 1 TsaB [Cyanobacterium aponinum]WRL37807.1 tRNA (adenosine(37)-N6)-threonylcarbamoyltransferase complex dimerization subunit type 1 TsaB [Cyanobacterium aponinum UTEX 3221]WRL41715.1 tRNA (adenosine(37)-N6)-threonylcarbamoyltransferase complex dimerization subunit type 1 TsaB [Cyanobacterium aponinum UTEX 3222]
MNKKGLALHTTTGELGVAFVDNQGKYYCQSWDLGRDLANQLQVKLQEFIAPLCLWSDLDFLVVAIGPGSYTSTRIGVVTAKTLAQQLNIPVYGISTLETLAWNQAINKPENSLLAIEMRANNEDVYGGIYQKKSNDLLIKILADEQFKKQKWTEIVSKYKVKFEEKIEVIFAPDKLGFTAKNLLEIAEIKINCEGIINIDSWQTLQPFYN